MNSELLRMLISTTLASSAAIVLVGLLRRPIRALAGARAAYWLWLLVPAMVAAVLLPSPPPLLTSVQVTVPEQIRSALLAATAARPSSNGVTYIDLALAIWIAGGLAMFLYMLARQWSFARSLGALTRHADGLYRCDAAVAPMLLGIANAKIVVPANFESLYSPAERELVVAHERAHAVRLDNTVNAVAAIALCCFWFNPLVYRAVSWLRWDQELACDAAVLARRGAERRRYADALLRTQLATESAWRQPVGSHWQSIHPLKERISMLKRPLPGRSRRLMGLAAIVTFTGLTSYAVWAGQAATDTTPTVLVNMQITITTLLGDGRTDAMALKTQYLVYSGEEIKDPDGHPLNYASCTPYLPDEPGQVTDWSDLRARGIPLPAAGQILLDCVVRDADEVVGRPALIVKDGKLGIIEVGKQDGPHYRIEVTASTNWQGTPADPRLRRY